MELLPWAFGRQMVSCFLGNSLVRFSDVSEKRYRRYSEHIALPGVKWSENNASAQDIVRCFGMFHAAPASLLLLLLEPGVHRQMTRAVNVLLPVGAAAEDLRAVLVLGLGPALAKAILEKCASLHSRACVSLYISNQEFCSITRELVGSGRSRWLSARVPFLPLWAARHHFLYSNFGSSTVCCSCLCYPAMEQSSRHSGSAVHVQSPEQSDEPRAGCAAALAAISRFGSEQRSGGLRRPGALHRGFPHSSFVAPSPNLKYKAL